jgi:hypothetical protein
VLRVTADARGNKELHDLSFQLKVLPGDSDAIAAVKEGREPEVPEDASGSQPAAVSESEIEWYDDPRQAPNMRMLAKTIRLPSAKLLFGGAFLVICDTVARTAFAPTELPVGIFTS